VLAVNSAHLASLSSPDTDRWLPIFWAIDQFKSSQAADVREGDWTMGPVDESAVPPSHKAKPALIEAMDNWDESAADAAIVGLARTAARMRSLKSFAATARAISGRSPQGNLRGEQFSHAGGHRLAARRAGVRSLAYAIMDRAGTKENRPSRFARRPSVPPQPRSNKTNPRRLARRKPNGDATAEMLQAIREGSAVDTSEKAIELLNRGAAPQSLFDAFFDGAGELADARAGHMSLHATTFTNALHYAWQRCPRRRNAQAVAAAERRVPAAVPRQQQG